MNGTSAPRQSRMTAGRHDPWVSVSLLAEHTYCARAGVIMHEQPEDETDDDTNRFRLAWGPVPTFYSLSQIRSELHGLQHRMLWIANAVAVASIMAFRWAPIWIIAAVLFLFYCRFLLRWLHLFLLRYLPARLKRGAVPPDNHEDPLPIHWWSLLNAGFQVVRPSEQYSDDDWRLVGCPWRILVKGDLRIPVWRKRSKKKAGEKENDHLYEQHKARMTAYCHLLERSEGGKSPYGVVLLGRTLKGVTLPNHPKFKKIFHDSLLATRSTIQLLPSEPDEPADSQKRCLSCPHSKRDRTTGESVCGGRFGWEPPNERDYLYR